MTERLDVKKTYKLFIGGAFPRSESGRSYPIPSAKNPIAHPAQASRKDLRESVNAAHEAASSWAGATAYNRSQILYRIAEIMEGRREQFVSEIIALTGVNRVKAAAEVSEAIDLWVWYAGWCDKIDSVSGSTNPVNGPYYNFSSYEPVGVVGIFAEEESALLGIVRTLAPVLAGGNAALLIASEKYPLPAITLAEVFATSDVPKGVVNVLTGIRSELAPWLASHMEVDAIDISGIGKSSADMKLKSEIRLQGVENLKRIFDHGVSTTPERILSFMETKTVWHPIGI
ncbi:MAG: aldehyde dehydrogenase family protein [Candidatus Nanopelagicaceae bacterium]|jgi:acyl-CoA reductase-like NAD-dependent aldehyde dehydrogenase